jgi:hypothetical protein
MVVHKKILEDVKQRLMNDLGKVHMEINHNRYEIKKLAERQSVLKREIKEFYKLIRSLPISKEKK